MKFYDDRYLVYDSESKFKIGKLTAEGLESIGGKGKILLREHADTGLVLPYDKMKERMNPNNVTMSGWIKQMINNASRADMARVGLANRLSEAGVTFTDEDVTAIIQAPIEADALRNSPVTAEVLAYTDGDFKVNTLLQRRVLVDDVDYPHPNKRLVQQEIDDLVGLRLPDADVIVTHMLETPYQSTEFDQLIPSYPNRLYRTKSIVSILTSTTPQARKKNIESALYDLTRSYKIQVSEKEKSRILTAFEILPLDHVIGNPDNDTLEIQENEMAFYENIISFIKYHIHKFNKEVMVNVSEEEIRAKSEQDFATGNLPVRLTEYFEQILSDTLNANFYHTGNFNYIIGDLDDPDADDDSEGGDNDDGSVNVIITKEDVSKSDLHIAAVSYLGLSARTFGASVWAEGIIKTMRWGERKVRNLNVGLNNTQYLDLQTMNLVTQQLADLSQFEVDSDEEGRSLDVLAMSYTDFRPEGAKRSSSYPFLLVAVERGFIPGAETEISVSYITTLFDIVHAYTKGQPSIFDVALVDGKFISESSALELSTIDISELRQLSKNSKVKISDELMYYAIDNAIPKMEGPAVSVLRKEDFEPYKSTDLLLDRLADTPKPIRASVVYGGLLSVFEEGAQDFESDDLIELLNWYYAEVFPIHLAGYNKILGIEDEDTSKLNVKNLKTANFFGTEEVEETREEIEEFMYPIYEGPELAFNKIGRSGSDDTAVGGYAVTPEGTFVFAGLDEIPSMAVSGQNVHTGKVLMKLFEVMLGADTNTGYSAPHKVMSSQTIFKIYSALYGK